MTSYFAEDDRRDRYLVTNPAGQSVFNITFPLDDVDYIKVYIDGTEQDAADYTVDLDALTVTLDTAADEDAIVTLEGNRSIELVNAFPLRGEFRSAKLNNELTGILQMIQELRRDVDRQLILNKAEASSASNIMPLLSADKIVKVNSAGTAFELVTIASLAATLDILLTGEASGDFLKYDGTNWVNRTAAQVRTDLSLQALALKATIDNVALIDNGIIISDHIAAATIALGKLATMASGNVLGNLSGGDAVPDIIAVVNDLANAASTKLADSQAIKDYIDTAVAGVGGGKVLQVKQVVSTTPFGTTSGSFVDTGVSLALDNDLASTASKVLVMVSGVAGATDHSSVAGLTLFRDAENLTPTDMECMTGVNVGSSSGTSTTIDEFMQPFSFEFLDSPASVTPAAYKLYLARIFGSSATVYVGRSGDNNRQGPTVITIMEIAG